MFHAQCTRVEFGYKVNNEHVDTTILIAKNKQHKELFRVKKEHIRNGYFPSPQEHRYTVIRSGKTIATVALNDNEPEYKTDFLEREIYNLLDKRIKFQRETAQHIGKAFIKMLDNKYQSKIK